MIPAGENSLNENCPVMPKTLARGAGRGFVAPEASPTACSGTFMDIDPGVKLTVPGLPTKNGWSKDHPQTGPGEAPLMVPEQPEKQSPKMSAVTHVGAGAAAGAAWGRGAAFEKGARPPEGEPPKGPRTPTTIGRTKAAGLGAFGRQRFPTRVFPGGHRGRGRRGGMAMSFFSFRLRL